MQFDLENTVVSRYQGEARLQRLLWIATSSSGEGNAALAQQALTLAHEHAKELGNIRRYKEVFHLQPEATVDVQWLTTQNERNHAARQVLQQRLQSAQSHLNKEAIRVAYQALASHDERTGNLNDAFHSALRAKDYCTSRPQQAAVSLHILQVALYLQNYKTVQEYSHKLTHTTTLINSNSSNNASGSGRANTAGEDAVLRYKVAVAVGLERLAAREYPAAAKKLVEALYAAVEANHETPTNNNNNNAAAAENANAAGMGTGGSSGAATAAASRSASSNGTASTAASWNAVLAPEDVALFAAFLALAALESRSDLLALAEHAEALELVPVAREAVLMAAKRADYAGAWKLLEESVFAPLRLDLYMAFHLQALKDRVREKFLLQHWQAYQCISLQALQQKVGKGILPDPAEKILTDLIQRGCFPRDTRLDLQKQTLVRIQQTDSAAATKLQKVSARVLDDTYSMVIRLACLEEDLCVADPNTRSRRRGHRYGGAGFGGSVVLMESDGEEDDGDAPMADAVAAVDEMNPEDLY